LGQQIDCWNLALAHLDLGQRVQSLAEQSQPASACATFWDRARKKVLEQCYWSFATKTEALALLLDQSTITNVSQTVYPGWRFIYQRPQDSLKAQAVTSWYGLREYPFLSSWWGGPQGQNYTGWGAYKPPWCEMLDQIQTPPGQAVDILTDQGGAWLVYTTDINIAVASETFLDCVAWELACCISGAVSANQKAKEAALKMAPLALSRALAQNLNEQQTDPYPDSPSITARY
jgi:hypothetical protein